MATLFIVGSQIIMLTIAAYGYILTAIIFQSLMCLLAYWWLGT
jgi:hypothetical protein